MTIAARGSLQLFGFEDSGGWVAPAAFLQCAIEQAIWRNITSKNELAATIVYQAMIDAAFKGAAGVNLPLDSA